MHNDFETDDHRRVLANLSIPRSVVGLQRELDGDDNVELGIGDDEEIDSILEDLRADGLAKRIGSHDEAKSLVEKVQSDKDAIDLPRDKARTFQKRAETRPARYLDGEQWIMTGRGLDKLTAPAKEG